MFNIIRIVNGSMTCVILILRSYISQVLNGNTQRLHDTNQVAHENQYMPRAFSRLLFAIGTTSSIGHHQLESNIS